MLGDQFGEFLRAISGDLLEPPSRLGMGAGSADPRQAGISHVAHERVFEGELEIAGDGRGWMNRYQALSLEREQARHQVGVSSRPPHRFLSEDASDNGGFLQSALVSACARVDASRP